MSRADTLLWLSRIPSPIGEEQALCSAIQDRLSGVELAGPIRRYGDSLVVPLTRGTRGPHIALVGHLDVVRTDHDGPPRIEGNRLYAPGAADMKSGLALMVELAERVPRPAVDLTLVFYAREEGPYADNELAVVLEQDRELGSVDLAVALEPSDNKLQLGCGGSVHATLTFRGETAHSARPWQGKNAIYEALDVLGRLARLKPERLEVEGLVWWNVISATLARGGRARNIVPDVFELNVNHRFGPGISLEEAKARITELVDGAAEIDFVDLSPAAPPHRSHPLVRALGESGVVAVEPKQAWTDVARFAQRGIAAVNFGPGVQAQAHQRNEWTLLDQQATGMEILLRWLSRIAAGALTAE